MKQKSLLLSGLFILLIHCASGQAKLVEKVTKTGNEIVIPYESMYCPTG